MATGIVAIEVRYRPQDTGANWVVESFPPDSEVISLKGLQRGQFYDAEARSIGANGRNSDWVPATFEVPAAANTPLPTGYRALTQQNLPQTNTTNYGSIRDVTALTAHSDGSINVNAHTVYYGSTATPYSAVTAAITGIAVGARVAVYCIDENYQGGVRTWYTAATATAAMQLGDGVVVAGEVTIPSSGSGGGGGGGGDWCVDWAAVLPDGRLVRSLLPGDMVPCWDGKDAASVELVRLRAIGFGEEESFTLVSATGRITQSASTPMDTRDGRIVRTADMLGEEVLTFNGLHWEPVVQVIHAGTRRVIKPDLGNRMFFAGDSAESAIATHNAIYKP